MPANSALDEMLKMIRRRALEIAGLPVARREGRHEIIHDATRRASIGIGQGGDEAAKTANSVVGFVAADRLALLVTQVDCGEGDQPFDCARFEKRARSSGNPGP